MLVTGYKFHLRIYMLVTSTTPEVRAYVHNDGHAMFCTKEFTMDANTLGKHFDGTVHLSNYDINCTPKNMDLYLDQKGDVGPGCCRPISWLCDWIAANRADVPVAGMWRQIHRICHHAANYIAEYPTVTKWHEVDDAGGDARAHRHSELFGVDMMLDAAGKVWLLEVNNSPGLEYCDSHETGVCPDAGWNDDVTKQICHDRFALLGMDRDVCAKGDANNFVRVC
jgi:hypothetical protein